MVMDILTFPSKRLKQKSTPFTDADFNDELQTLVKNMTDTMLNAEGVGLAAPQVGVLKRMFILDIALIDARAENGNKDPEKDPEPKIEAFINPVLELSGEVVVDQEACLSIPEEHYAVARYKDLTIKYLDQFKTEKTLTVSGYFAKAIQHEYDHLDGILYIDRLPMYKKESAIKKIKKRIAEDDYQVVE